MAKYVELGQSDNRDIDLTDVKLVKLLPETEQLEVEPTTEEQIFKPSAEKYFDEVSVGKIKTETAIVKSNESEKIIYPSKEHFFDEIQVESLILEDITLEPTTSSQNVKASEGFDAIKSVRLNAVNPSDYYKPEESITIQPKTTPQVINPPLDHVFNLINVSAVTSEIDSNIIPTNIRKGKTILGVQGNMEADKPDQEKVVEASITNDVIVTADVGYELSKVTIQKVDVSKYVKEEISVDITPTEIEQVLIPRNNQVYNRVQVGAIPSDYIGSSIARVSEQSYIPTTTDIEIQANQFLSGKQTIKGDVNLVAENIAEGKEIFGILGTHQGGSVKFSELVDGSITEVTAQDLADVTTIRDDVFANLGITKVEIPSNVIEIGDSAFANNEISSLTLNEGVQTIGASAFANNPITTLTIPSSVTSIGVSAFGGTQITELDMSNVHTPPTVDATSFPSTLTAIHVAYGDYDAYLTSWSAYADKIVRGLAIPSTITVTVNNYLGELVSGASVTISGNGQVYTGTTDSFGVFSQGDLQPATYTISVADLEGFKAPDIQEVVVLEDTQNSVMVTYLEKPLMTTYGIKIDLNNSDPETSVTYTDDAVGFDKSYMDFSNDTFVYGSWANKFPFNQIRPCILKDGVVITYLNPNNYAEDINGNAVDITSTCDGDVMIEIPKVYYRLYKDENYQYVQISDTAQEGFCCLAHTYKGVEKDKVYIGAYQLYYDGTSARSVSGVSTTGNISLTSCRTYAQKKGVGYENFYWNLLVLLQTLYTIQFKNLNCQASLGFGLSSGQVHKNSGELNNKHLYYGTSTAGKMKFMGIEDFYGNRYQWIDGVYINQDNSKLTIADATNINMNFNDNGSGYLSTSFTYLNNSGYIKSISGTNESGFVPTSFGGSEETYYCDYVQYYSSCIYFGGYVGNQYNQPRGKCGLYNFTTSSASNGYAYTGGRLTYCG